MRESRARDGNAEEVAGRVASGQYIVRVVTRGSGSHGSDHVVVVVVPLPLVTAGVPPTGGGDVNRDWEGCGKGETAETAPRIEEEDGEGEKVGTKAKRTSLRHRRHR